ncbi:MAG TPA: GrpB family protein [Ktedonobacteraceae bacterium]|jgi:GrpB-like predicted nucleotidyltransferase (UPF0157 family)|nr:GrpB family protein [Ktedonobacteraceae bacterium]
MEQTPGGNHWKDHYASERERLIAALGTIPDGGIIEQIEHVGATSIPGLFRQPCVDIALAVWPFPLEASAREALASLGYELDPGFASAPEQRFRHASGMFRLYLIEPGSPLWTDYILVSEYLRHDEAARQTLSARKQAWVGDIESGDYHETKRHWFDQMLDDAHQLWIEREGFSPLQRVADEMRDYPHSWYICGGWALDLFLGQVTRVHQDVDVVISRADQLALQQYLLERGWKLVTPFEERLHPWPVHMRLELPRHQVHAHRNGAFMDFLLTNLDGEVWRFRREPFIIRHMSRAALRSDGGIPFLAPELVLLFKSKNTTGKDRGKDQSDFAKICTLLEPERRAWLRWALIATNPSHAWIEQL